MTNPLKIIRSLDTVSTGYTVFEKDQVLTEKQLNSLSSYFEDQNRLTRIELLGVGIIGGLRLRLVDNKVIVSKGVGVTTDGDLLVLPEHVSFDRIKPYTDTAPFYAPLHPAGVMIKAFELVREGKHDELAQPMSSLPEKPAEMVCVMLMESCQKDHELCSGTGCDNLGKEAVNTVRLLLVSHADAHSLRKDLASYRERSLKLPVIAVDRPLITVKITTTLALAALYRDACNKIFPNLVLSFTNLDKIFPGLIHDLFNGDPIHGWISTLNAKSALFAEQDLGIQYYYDFLKDLAETWNALRDVLFDDVSVLCPDVAAFPKHLLLGSLSNPVEMRTGLYPSPLTGNGNSVREHARFLVRKLHTLINSFEPPTDSAVVVTPSSDESVPLEERAIPYYYKFKSDFPIHLGWNYRLEMRRAATCNLGYRAAAYGGSAATLKPLNYQLGRYNFFRIEGHLGQNVEKAKKDIEDAITNYNLPFTLRAVLLHNDRKKIIIRPPIRYGDLHRFHHILRKDLSLQLENTKQFNDKFKEQIDGALSRQEIPDQNISTTANARYGEIAKAVDEAAPLLGKSLYSDYQQASQTKDWRGAYTAVINGAGNFKETLGEIVRTDHTTVFDTLVSNNHPAWLDWLDTLIQSKDKQEDSKLMFPKFCEQHPSLEHFGGVSRGGTFVMIYDDQAKVVADFMLPYNWPEASEGEPEIDELPTFDFKLPILINGGYKLLPPLKEQFNSRLVEFEAKNKNTWMEQVNIQKDHMTFFKDAVGALTDIAGSKAGSKIIEVGSAGNYTDELLKIHIDDVEAKTKQVGALRRRLEDVTLPEDARKQTITMLTNIENSLGESIANATSYIVENKIVISGADDGGKALNTMSQSLSNVTDSNARAALGKQLTGLQEKASGMESPAQAAAIGNLIEAGGFNTR